jgi:hypothetical protein
MRCTARRHSGAQYPSAVARRRPGRDAIAAAAGARRFPSGGPTPRCTRLRRGHRYAAPLFIRVVAGRATQAGQRRVDHAEHSGNQGRIADLSAYLFQLAARGSARPGFIAAAHLPHQTGDRSGSGFLDRRSPSATAQRSSRARDDPAERARAERIAAGMALVRLWSHGARPERIRSRRIVPAGVGQLARAVGRHAWGIPTAGSNATPSYGGRGPTRVRAADLPQ